MKNKIKIKVLELEINSCSKCPFLIFSLSTIESDNDQFTCTFEEKNIKFLENDSVLSIPNWCPIPDEYKEK